MSSAPQKVYVVIVTYNALRWADRCFPSLRASGYPVQTVVVDNNSSDDTVAVLRSQFPEVHVIANGHNAGFGAANNQGISWALTNQADFVFLLNQDTWIFPDTVGKLVAAASREPQYGIVSPMHFAADEVTLDGAFASYLVKDYTEQPDMLHEGIHPSGFINAAAWFIHRQCLEVVGGFGPLFYHYGEDRDYVQRIHYHHYQLGFLNTARIVHDRPPKRFTIDTAEKASWYYTTGAKARLANINRPYPVAWISVWLWMVNDMIALILKGKRFALPVAFKISYAVFIRGSKEIIQYRKKISEKTRYRFLKND